ncbi:MAG: ATP-binding protein [Candidatus Binatia bacterium]
MERRYERLEVVGRCKKSSSAGAENPIRHKARLTAKQYGSLRERQPSEHRPQEIEWLASLGTRAAVFAHEVGNPLCGILLSLQSVESRLKKNQIHDSFSISVIRNAIGEIDRLGSLLREFRALATEQTLDLKRIDLVKIVEETLALERTAYGATGITVKFDFEDALPLVRVDAAKIRQVILNLCKNATEAMPDGGCLTVKGYRSRGMVVLEICDTGVGIADDVNIFESFKTTKPGGMGLGLPLVQQIVSTHNGTIACQSELGRGAKFKVSLPISESTAMG